MVRLTEKLPIIYCFRRSQGREAQLQDEGFQNTYFMEHNYMDGTQLFGIERIELLDFSYMTQNSVMA